MFKYKCTVAVILMTVVLSSCGMLRPADNGDSDITTITTTTVTQAETTEAVTETEVVTTEEPVVSTETTETVTETTTEEPVITEPAVTEPPVITTEPPVTTTTVTTTAAPTEPPVTTTAAPVTPPENGVTSKGYTITVENGITYVDGVLIANKTYGLPESYYTGGLTAETYGAFLEMQAAASGAGHYLYVRSGFRSYIDQKIIYWDYVSRDGQAAADRYSARPGHSEHQSGMAIDVNETTYAFGESPAGIWMKENCHKYGFIIRYPEGKEDITGYMYEPWHIRYVGVELAEKVAAIGLTLEEYFGITSAYAE